MTQFRGLLSAFLMTVCLTATAGEPNYPLPPESNRSESDSKKYKWYSENEIPEESKRLGMKAGWFYEYEYTTEIKGKQRIGEDNPLAPAPVVDAVIKFKDKSWARDPKANARCNQIVNASPLRSKEDFEKLSLKDLARNMCVDSASEFYCGANGKNYREKGDSGRMMDNRYIQYTSYNTVQTDLMPEGAHQGPQFQFKNGNGIYEAARIDVKAVPGSSDQCEVQVYLQLPNGKEKEKIRCDGSKKDGLFGFMNPVQDSCGVTLRMPFKAKGKSGGKPDCQKEVGLMAGRDGLVGYKAPISCDEMVKNLSIDREGYQTLTSLMSKDRESEIGDSSQSSNRRGIAKQKDFGTTSGRLGESSASEVDVAK